MRMFVLSGFVFAAVVASAAAPALAYENFIPMGTGYSTEVDSVPGFETERGHVSETADVLETEIYFRNRGAAEFDSQIRAFQSGNEFKNSSTFIDY